MSPFVGYSAIGVAVLAIGWFVRVDTDPGGYDDTFRTVDKREHALGGFVIALVAGALSGQPWAGAAYATALGIGWEVMQACPRGGISATQRYGFASWRDVVADAAGASVAALGLTALAWVTR